MSAASPASALAALLANTQCCTVLGNLPRTANSALGALKGLGLFSWLVGGLLFFVVVVFSFWGVFCGFVWLGVFNRTIQKKTKNCNAGSETGHGSPTDSLCEKSKAGVSDIRHLKSMALIYTTLSP